MWLALRARKIKQILAALDSVSALVILVHKN